MLLHTFVERTPRLRRTDRRFLADHLTRSGSDFQEALLAGELKGTIALCLDQGEIVGWARTEVWKGLPTLEAFVARPYRRRGVATLCSAALVASGTYDNVEVIAVFSPLLLPIARSLHLPHRLYDLKPDGTWRPA